MESSYDSPSHEKSRIPLLKGTEDYFSWSRVMKARLDRLKAWSPIVSHPPVNRGRTKAPITLARFREQFDQLNLDLDSTGWNQRQWDAAYEDYKEEIREFNEWQDKEKMALSEIIERLSPTVLTRMNRYSTPKTLWEALEQAYAAPLITEQLRALQNLLSLRRSQYPDIRQFTTAHKTAYDHLTYNLRFSWDPTTLPTLLLLWSENNDSNSSSNWSKFLEKYKNGTQLADPEELYTTLHGLGEDPKKDTKKPAPSANVITGKRKRNDASQGGRSKQQRTSTCSECHKTHALKEGQFCWYKNPEKAPEGWQKKHPHLLNK
ncbi:hypothetical protein EPUS_06403 [Endocarpon pusillum Z07020]|uniref:DUF4219 domain-containing protein n=1 Tax=Endocarpon pusillum (strain Z07020 / HMAS-L-300199) TaxID=1263415 RepID=U1G7P5_ENDPU|nr:uncharacterized protein EPUS_06403 [Endocarpon pusillum Z07020]ERF68013.1 hypothetical protein EPUS_06403 [Endocarpon pusillum Z07020]